MASLSQLTFATTTLLTLTSGSLLAQDTPESDQVTFDTGTFCAELSNDDTLFDCTATLADWTTDTAAKVQQAAYKHLNSFTTFERMGAEAGRLNILLGQQLGSCRRLDDSIIDEIILDQRRYFVAQEAKACLGTTRDILDSNGVHFFSEVTPENLDAIEIIADCLNNEDKTSCAAEDWEEAPAESVTSPLPYVEGFNEMAERIFGHNQTPEEAQIIETDIDPADIEYATRLINNLSDACTGMTDSLETKKVCIVKTISSSQELMLGFADAIDTARDQGDVSEENRALARSTLINQCQTPLLEGFGTDIIGSAEALKQRATEIGLGCNTAFDQAAELTVEWQPVTRATYENFLQCMDGNTEECHLDSMRTPHPEILLLEK